MILFQITSLSVFNFYFISNNFIIWRKTASIKVRWFFLLFVMRWRAVAFTQHNLNKRMFVAFFFTRYKKNSKQFLYFWKKLYHIFYVQILYIFFNSYYSSWWLVKFNKKINKIEFVALSMRCWWQEKLIFSLKKKRFEFYLLCWLFILLWFRWTLFSSKFT